MSWDNTVSSCPLCNMDKRTKWYKETEDFVVAKKLTGGPFVVIKNHIENPSQSAIEEAHDTVETVFGEHEFRVLMGIVEDHWHAHIVTEESKLDLSDE